MPNKDDVERMKKLVSDVFQHPEKWYQCNRGPRPSAAVLVTPQGKEIAGMVCPPEEEDANCLVHGCEIEYSMLHHNGSINLRESAVDLLPHCVRNIHAEVDALLAAARFGVKTFNATIYTINKPCYNCAKALAKAGISKVVYGWAAYDEPRTNTILRNSRIEVVQVEMEEPAWQEF